MRPHAALALFLTLLIAACDQEVPAEEGPWHPPDEPGPHAIATLETEAPSGAGIQLPVQVWLPALDAGGGPWSYDGLAEGDAPEWSTPDCSQAWPVVVFSHGNGGINFQSYSVMEFFATHGWLVAAPDHVDNTTFDMVDDWPRIAMRRPLDVADTFDHLVALSDDPASRLTGCVDGADGYAVMGHSFGGFTSFAVAGAEHDMVAIDAACQEETEPEPGCAAVADWLNDHPGEQLADHSDDRAWAAVPWAPAWYQAFGGSIERIEIPTLVIGADRDGLTGWDDTVEPAYRQLTTTPRALAGLVDAGHYSFTDLCGPLGSVMGSDDGCSEGFRDYVEVMETTRTLSLAFLMVQRGEERAAEFLPTETGMSHWEAVE